MFQIHVPTLPREVIEQLSDHSALDLVHLRDFMLTPSGLTKSLTGAERERTVEVCNLELARRAQWN